jgi:hypothetical protein
LRAEFPSLELRLRPHNADRRTKEWRRISERYGMEYSDFDVEISFHFLSRVDAILSGDSGILLEAALLDVYAIYYDFPGTATDLYGFCKAGLIDYARDLDGLLPRVRELLRKKPSIRHRTRPYCATIGTAHEGRSAALAGSLIERFARNGTARFDGWSRLADAPIEAYEPSEAGP